MIILTKTGFAFLVNMCVCFENVSPFQEGVPLYYVHGDVTKPQREEGDHSKCQLILHCVDNSGTFGSRGVFAALRAKDPSIADRYELISRMGDMKIGDAHLINDVKDMRGTSLSWYTVERLIKKCISDYGVPTYIYYFARQHRPQSPSPPPQSPRAPAKRLKPAPRGPSKRPKVERTSGDFVVDDEDEEEEEESSSSSASSSASEIDWCEDEEEEEEDGA
ncbi:hypothetical protein ANCDUO_04658 [Ancylostoma duodenale]|uniref:Uncharacterized protein n=1 Tax=Ancylostoma duodenale TaxID=51022 RepID=A0A0C2DQN5_9BILA|nr:hypothetical protein ANCDUO_04658 [Ancylostoma duodenale]